MLYSVRASHFSKLIILKKVLDEQIIIFKRHELENSLVTNFKTKNYLIDKKDDLQ